MKQFNYFVPTKIMMGKNVVRENGTLFKSFGERAMIVTGAASGKMSGALDDVLAVFEENGIECLIFDSVLNNPTLENVRDGGIKCKEFRADFIVGIGGGSPLDASKAIAVLAVNNIEPLDLFTNKFENKPLPIIAIPTTAGTGSEVTPYSILTRADLQTKMGFGNDDTFPKIALLDAKYTETLSKDVTINTAVDAFSHALEGYLAKRSMPISDTLAEEAMRVFGEVLPSLQNQEYTMETREKLLYASTLAGMVISHTATTLVHGMGYSLTYFKGLPHGAANGVLIPEYLKFNYCEEKEKIDKVLSLIKVGSIESLQERLESLLNVTIDVTDEEIEKFAKITMNIKSTLNTARQVNEADVMDILKKSTLRYP